MSNVMSMGSLGNKFILAVTIQSYEFLKDLDIKQIKVLMEDKAEFVNSITDKVCNVYQQHKRVSEEIHNKFNENQGMQFYADRLKCMIEFLLDVQEETILHEMQFEGLKNALKMLSKDIANLF